MLMALIHARHVIPSSTLAALVQALVISAIRYCLSVYGACNIGQVKRIQKIINFGAQVVSGKRRFDHVSSVVRRLGWLSAEQLIEYHAVCLMRNVLVTGQPEAMNCAVGPPSNQHHSHVTRRATQRSLSRIRRKSGRRQLCYRGVKLLNAAKSPIADQQFRRNFKRELLSREATSE